MSPARPAPRPPTPTLRPLLCSSVPSEFPGDRDWGPPGYESDQNGEEDDDGDDAELEEGRGASRAWGDDALVSGDPAAIEAAWGHAVDFVVDAGILEVTPEFDF